MSQHRKKVNGRYEYLREGDWGYFKPKFGLTLLIERGGYFDSRYGLRICFIWGYLYLKLPFKTKLSHGCDTPRYGLDNHSGILWLYWGGEYENSIGQMKRENQISFYYPFYNYDFENHMVMNKNGRWQIVKSGEYNADIYEWAETIELPYVYKLKSGKKQNRTAKCYKEKRQWHRKWFPFLKKTSVNLDITFSDEVGERSGSWKGGVVGCGYEMKDNETMKECLKRMETERVFK